MLLSCVDVANTALVQAPMQMCALIARVFRAFAATPPPQNLLNKDLGEYPGKRRLSWRTLLRM
jgi:hypothetical protein